MELTTMGFHHVGLVVADAERALGFYRDVLGMALVSRSGAAGAEDLWFGDAAGTPGTLLSVVEARVPHGNWGLGSVHHTAFVAEDDEALLRWKRRLNDHGHHVYGPVDRRWFHSLYFSDPDGQVLEIATRGPGYTLDEPIGQLGEQDIIPGPENLAGQRDEQAIETATWPDPVPEITTEMALGGIHHVSGITDHVERADAFLTAALGLRLIKRTVNQDDPRTPHWFWARYDGQAVAPHSSYTLFGWPRGGRPSRPGTGQTHHVAFRAADADELLAWRTHLLSLKIEVSAVTDRGPYRVISFPSPDGLLLEIATD
ncbi:MAG TPA: VOC family protein [Longimicrobium sp.]|jgi:glyoxalase family protein